MFAITEFVITEFHCNIFSIKYFVFSFRPLELQLPLFKKLKFRSSISTHADRSFPTASSPRTTSAPAPTTPTPARVIPAGRSSTNPHPTGRGSWSGSFRSELQNADKENLESILESVDTWTGSDTLSGLNFFCWSSIFLKLN